MVEGFIDTAVSMEDQRSVFSEQPEPINTSQVERDIFSHCLKFLKLQLANYEPTRAMEIVSICKFLLSDCVSVRSCSCDILQPQEKNKAQLELALCCKFVVVTVILTGQTSWQLDVH